MESILNGYEDPRREIYFATCQDEQFAGEYRGIRQVHALHITIIIHSQN